MTDGAASIGHLDHCAHPGCLCRVHPGDRYCGDFCRAAAEGEPRVELPMHDEPGRCACGHSACEE